MMENISSTPWTRRAFALSALVLLATYAIFYVAQEKPPFRATATSTKPISNDTTVYNSFSGIAGSRPATPSSSINGNTFMAARRCQLKGERLARPFGIGRNLLLPTIDDDTGPPYWCTQDTYDKSCRTSQHMLCPPKGLLFVKTPKTGSTTISRIVKRIVSNVAQRYKNVGHDSTEVACQHREDHINGAGLWYGNRVHNQSFLVASLRNPAERAMSRFFWSYVTRHSPNGTEVPVDDAFVVDYLNKSTSVANGCTSKGQGGYQLNYIAMESIKEWSAWHPLHPTQVIQPKAIEQLVHRTLQEYDFVILNERMEESLVLLQLLLGLEVGDIVGMAYNVGGSYRYEHGKCKQLIKSHASIGMQHYFRSDEWMAKNYGDYVLFAAVNRSIDLTIEKVVGRDRFDAALKDFQQLEATVNDVCSKRVPFPCSANGTVLSHTDHPVPHEKIARCIDKVVRENQQLRTKQNSFGIGEGNWHP